ncbi:MAG: hypothetical protein ACHQQS_11465 [Thermoanaerobaculales bacterium]
MKRLVLTVFTVLAVVAASPLLAVVAGTDLYIPAVAHAPGAAGAQWRADAWIFNPSTTQSASVTIYLLLRQPNPNPTSQVVTVNPMETRYFPDIIGSGLFQQTNASGGLHFISTLPVVITAESYNANVTTSKGTGTSGQFFGAVPANYAVGAGAVTDVIGLDQDAAAATGRFRSNLGLVEATGGNNTVNFVLDRLDANGTVVGSWACDGTNPSCAPLGPWEVRQFDYVLQNFSPQTGSNQRIRIRVTGGTGRIIGAGSRIDNTTGDPSTIEMSGAYAYGRFEGTIPGVPGASLIDGGLVMVVGNGGVTSFEGAAGIPCGTDSSGALIDYVLDFGLDPQQHAGPFAIASDGTFSTQVSFGYGDQSGTWFTTNWTLSGARQPDGTWVGTLVSDTSGGTGANAPCNVTGVTRNWRAGWTGSS